MREHFSIKREDSQTEPRHNGPLGRPALQVRDLRARSHKIPSAHFLHPDSTLESLIRATASFQRTLMEPWQIKDLLELAELLLKLSERESVGDDLADRPGNSRRP